MDDHARRRRLQRSKAEVTAWKEKLGDEEDGGRIWDRAREKVSH